MSRSRRSATAAGTPMLLLVVLVVLCGVAIATTATTASILVSPRRAHAHVQQRHRPLRPTPTPTTRAAPPPSSPVFSELTAILQQHQQHQDETATLAQPKYYINVYDNATSCTGKMSTSDLAPFEGNMGKCVENPSGSDSAVLSPCAINPGGDSDFAYAFFSQPMCAGAVNTTLYAAGTPTDNDGCFLVLVQTPTARGTVAIQAQCPPA